MKRNTDREHAKAGGDDLTQVYRIIKSRYFPDTEPEVLVPCCGVDERPSEVFSNVTYLDKDKTVVKRLKHDGLKASRGEVETALKEKYGLLIQVGLNANGVAEKTGSGYDIVNAEAGDMKKGGIMAVDECSRIASRVLRSCDVIAVEAINKKSGKIYNKDSYPNRENPFNLLNTNVNCTRESDKGFERRQEFIYIFRK
jgi:hypothetical protein